MKLLLNLLSEMRRRRVFQTAGIYIVGAWVILQVSDLAFEAWGLPDEGLRFIWSAAFGLFPVALVFGWRYDITAQGIVRTPDRDGSAPLKLTPIDYGILTAIAAIVAVSSYLMIDKISGLPTAESFAVFAPEEIDPHSIAVLPFNTLSDRDDTSFFADGIHDDLLTTLSNISALKVISRTSVMKYRDTAKNMRLIGRELGAANILEGAVQRAGEQVRINVQLIDAETDEHLWAHKFDRALSVKNIFAIQTEIAETIATQLAATISTAERGRIQRDRTDNLDAFNAYIEGKHLFARSSFEALRVAQQRFEEAIAIDPDYVLARVALARTFAQLADTGAITVDEMLANGQAHIDQAIKLDPNNGYAVAVMAKYINAAPAGAKDIFDKSLDFNPGRVNVDEDFQRAIELSPNDVEILDIYADYLRAQGRNEESLVYIRRALRLDPLSVTLFHDLGRASLALGRFDDAHQAFIRISQIDPQNPYAAHGSALATILSGQLAEAGHWSDAAAATDPLDFENPATSVFIYLSAGDTTTAAQRLEEALELGKNEPYPMAAQVYFLTVTGEPEKALSIARTALANEVEDRWRSHYVLLRVVRDAALESGNYDEALAWYRRLVPELFDAVPRIDANNISKAADAAHLLLASGEKDTAIAMLENVVDRYEELYNLGSANFPLGIANVDALTLLDRKDEALAELRRLFDDGWRLMWRWDTELNRNLDGLRDEPAFQDIVNDIREDLKAQSSQFAAKQS